MKKINIIRFFLIYLLLLPLSLLAQAKQNNQNNCYQSKSYECYRDEKNYITFTTERLNQWVDWNKVQHISRPAQALSAVQARYNITDLPGEFYELLTYKKFNFDDERVILVSLSENQVKILDEAAILFLVANSHFSSSPYANSLSTIRKDFLKALKLDLGLYTIHHGVEYNWEEVGNPLDVYRTAVFSVARQLYKEEYGKDKARQLDLMGHHETTYTLLLRHINILPLPFVQSIEDKLIHKIEFQPEEQYILLAHYLNSKAKNWKQQFRNINKEKSKAHPYARIGAYVEAKIDQQLTDINNGKYQFILSLPDGGIQLLELKRTLTWFKEFLVHMPNTHDFNYHLGKFVVNMAKAKSQQEIEAVIADSHDLFQTSKINNIFLRGMAETFVKTKEIELNMVTLGIYQLVKDSLAYAEEKPFIDHWAAELQARNRSTLWPDDYKNQEVNEIIGDAINVAANIALVFVAPFEEAATEGATVFKAIAQEQTFAKASTLEQTSFKNATGDLKGLWNRLFSNSFKSTLDSSPSARLINNFDQYNDLVGLIKTKELQTISETNLSDGVCNGLSFSWALEEVSGGRGAEALQFIRKIAKSKSLFKGGTGQESDFRLPMFKQLGRLHNTQTANFSDFKSLMNEVRNIAKLNGAELDDIGISEPAKMLDALNSGENQAILFRTNNHSMALSKVGGRFRFFEPNEGVVEIEQFDDLKQFIEMYLTDAKKSLEFSNGKLQWFLFKKNTISTKPTELQRLISGM